MIEDRNIKPQSLIPSHALLACGDEQEKIDRHRATTLSGQADVRTRPRQGSAQSRPDVSLEREWSSASIACLRFAGVTEGNSGGGSARVDRDGAGVGDPPAAEGPAAVAGWPAEADGGMAGACIEGTGASFVFAASTRGMDVDVVLGSRGFGTVDGTGSFDASRTRSISVAVVRRAGGSGVPLTSAPIIASPKIRCCSAASSVICRNSARAFASSAFHRR